MNKKVNSLFGLLVAQFIGAFNDNAWKLMVFTIATRSLALGVDREIFEWASQFQATLSMLIFLLPMLLFSIPAGGLADKYSKRSIIIATKALEVVIMAASVLVLFFAPTQVVIPYVLLGMVGMQSALFSPAKYGIMPEILSRETLTKGNGALEMWSMLAIIAGTGLGPVLLSADKGGLKPYLTWMGPLWLFLLSIVGLIAAFGVPKVPAAASNADPKKALKKAWEIIRLDQGLWLAVLGGVFYWYITSLLGQNVLVYAKALVVELEKGELWQGIPPASYGIGIALGAILAGRFSGGRVELGLIPLGAIGFSLSSLMLGLFQPAMFGTVVILILGGAASGLLLVPLHAIIQMRAPEQSRGAIIACCNLLDITGMILGSLTAMGMALLGWNLQVMLIWSAVFVIIATVWSVKVLPRALVRLCFVLLTRTIYGYRVRGIENVPEEGPAVLVSNHISVVDALLIMASLQRPVHFIMSEYYYNIWWFHPLAKLLGCVPVATTSSPRVLVESLKQAGEYLDRGELLCIFPEGQISHTGMMLPFQRGVEVIVRGRDCPIIPVYLDGVWGSVFSYKGGKFFFKIPKELTCELTVTFGAQMSASSSICQIRNAVKHLEHDAWDKRRERQTPILDRFVRSARHRPFRMAAADSYLGKLSRIKLLAGAIALAVRMKKKWADQQNIGLLLPTSVGGVIANLSALMAGKTMVNLNFTAGKEGVESAVEQAGIQTVITTRGLLKRIENPLPASVTCLYLEDLMLAITPWRKWISLWMACFSHPTRLRRAAGHTTGEVLPDDLLTIVFTSGSTGGPKGAMLSQFNVSCNVDAVEHILPSGVRRHNLMSSLPLFHSFGNMIMWLGLLHGHPLILQPNPLDFEETGNLVWQYKATLMMTAPTFLRGYMRRVSPGQFGTLRTVLTGAEKLPESTAVAFEKQFGLRPIEGYGATECSPVIAASTMSVRIQGICQIGAIPGTVGQPLPGVVVKVVDPQTYDSLPPDESGLLLVKGPNVMQGYYGNAQATKEVMHDGWYITGDIAAVDEEGFITITDRVSRFSKIAGEMVPHGRVEELLHQAAKTGEQLFLVMGVPCEKKGEKLVVLHMTGPERIPAFIRQLQDWGLPSLYIPKPEHFIEVNHFPLLGSGKVDLHAAKEVVGKALTI